MTDATFDRPAGGAAAGPASDLQPARRVEEVDAERLPDPPSFGQDLGGRFWEAFGPIVCGLVIDVVDLSTMSLVGVYLGFPVGALAGWFLAGLLRLGLAGRLGVAVAAGLYCMFPPTTFLPLATAVGALSRFFEPRRR